MWEILLTSVGARPGDTDVSGRTPAEVFSPLLKFGESVVPGYIPERETLYSVRKRLRVPVGARGGRRVVPVQARFCVND